MLILNISGRVVKMWFLKTMSGTASVVPASWLVMFRICEK
jgi:hypothetical protein